MYDNYNYPAGADTPSAPWNEREQKELPFDVCVTQVMMKNDVVVSNQYYAVAEVEEDGYGHVDYITDDIDWRDTWESQSMDILSLLKELEAYVTNELKNLSSEDRNSRNRRHYLKDVLASCQGWRVDETTVEEA